MIVYDVVQPSTEWHDLRLGRPTSSEFKRIICAKSAKFSKGAERYIDQLIGEKLAIGYPAAAESYTTRAMIWGTNTEQQARDLYALETKLDVRKIGFITTDDGRFGCSPDAMVFDADKIVGGTEIKCPEPETHMRWLRRWKTLKEFPPEHKAQVHGGLAVSNLGFWDFLSYVPGIDPLLIRTVPDAFTIELRVSLEIFWAKYQRAIAALSM